MRWSRFASVAVAMVVVVVPAAAASASPDVPSASTTASRADGLSAAAQHFAQGNVVLTQTPAGRAAVADAIAMAPEAALASSLSDRQLAGQRVIYSYDGLTPPARLLWLIRHGEAGGVIFFGANYASRSQFTRAVTQLRDANASSANPARSYPLLLMTDQEGGYVKRLPGAPAESEKQYGEITPLSAAKAVVKKAGRATALNLRSYGLNVNLAPVLDVFRTPGDFDDQYQRSYSSNQDVVSALGASFISGQQEHGVAATAKHFPGLGAATASQNTDERPVTLKVSAATLWSKDEYPYKAAIASGVDLVMVSWAVYPHLGSHRPAGLSSVIVQGQLRDRLGFHGVTITDSIGAGALKPYGSIEHRSLLAAEAGMQLILAADQSTPQGIQVMDALESGYRAGTLGGPDFRATVEQILKLRLSLGS